MYIAYANAQNFSSCIEGVCFHLSSRKVTWTGAVNYCINEADAMLTSIHSAAQTTYINEHVCPDGYCWIGLFEPRRAGWYWIDGSEVDYTNWDTETSTEPGGGEYFAAIWNNINWMWHDTIWERYYYAICSKKEDTTQPTQAPTTKPTFVPTLLPTIQPTTAPKTSPTTAPTTSPTTVTTTSPTTLIPTLVPTIQPTAAPTTSPTTPTLVPTIQPTTPPTTSPTTPTLVPTFQPTTPPTTSPTTPTLVPTIHPTSAPTTSSSTTMPTLVPTIQPTSAPTISSSSFMPTALPTRLTSTDHFISLSLHEFLVFLVIFIVMCLCCAFSTFVTCKGTQTSREFRQQFYMTSPNVEDGKANAVELQGARI